MDSDEAEGKQARMDQREGNLDTRVRAAAFGFLASLRQTFGTELPRRLLERGFDFNGQRVTLLGPQGIWKPAILPEMPLSITTVPPTNRKALPYNDEV